MTVDRDTNQLLTQASISSKLLDLELKLQMCDIRRRAAIMRVRNAIDSQGR